MATVPGGCGLADVVGVFGGPGELRSYTRGGGYVPDIPANYGVPTSADELSLAHLQGATNYVPLSASSTNPSSFGSQKGTYTVGTSTCSISGGIGGVSYSLSFLSGTNFFNSVSGNQATFSVTNTSFGDTTRRSGVFRWTVSDGISTATTDFTVTWN